MTKREKITLPEGIPLKAFQDFLDKYTGEEGDERINKPSITKSKKNCNNCWFQRISDKDCRLNSSSCVTAVFNGREPPRWMSFEEGQEVSATFLK